MEDKEFNWPLPKKLGMYRKLELVKSLELTDHSVSCVGICGSTFSDGV